MSDGLPINLVALLIWGKVLSKTHTVTLWLLLTTTYTLSLHALSARLTLLKLGKALKEELDAYFLE
jgi:hypothetical protein